MPDVIAVEARANVCILTLDRPERRNAMAPEMMATLAEQVRSAKDATAIVLTGAGSAFCVGADLKWLGGLPDPAVGISDLVAAHHEAVRAMRRARRPIVAAVNGAAAGGGLSLALAADYRVASTSAAFTTAYSRLGLTPDGGNSLFLAQSIGVARAMELLLTNRTLSVEEARSWGLVEEVVEPEYLLERACERASAFGAIPPETLLATRVLLDAASGQSLDSVLHAEQQAMRTAAQRPEFKQALRSFLERPKSG